MKIDMFVIVVLLIIFIVLYLAYTWALPKPLLGIPYDEAARRHLLGNVPDIMAHVRRTGRMRSWFSEHNLRHQAPLTQVWLRPFGRPTLFLADFRESQDILLRRNKEFDRGQRSVDLFAGPVPEHHISMLSSDPRYQRNKRLIRDLMTPHFLQEVAAPRVYEKAMALVQLWELKLEIARDRPFSAIRDISDAAIDIILAVAFDLDDEMSTVLRQISHLKRLGAKDLDIPMDADGSLDFPRVSPSVAIDACHAVGEYAGSLFKSLFPKALHRFKVMSNSRLRRHIRLKDEFIRSEIDKSIARLHGGRELKANSATDCVLRREVAIATSENRSPNFHSRWIYDELFGFFVAGYDTSTSAFSWLVKEISQNDRVQDKLRAALWAAYGSARDESRQPSATEILATPVPYLDAVIEESLRMHSPVGVQIREAIVDTEVLGHKITKGTNVFMIGTGPDFLSPPIPIPNDVRSKTSQSKYTYGTWDPQDMHLFKPERWIKSDVDGTEHYDHQSGPFLSFGLGRRGCSGRRLAYLELRIVLVLLLWNLKFDQLSGELGSFAAIDNMTTNPKGCHIRVSKLY
ncbi:cytochrome P450 [Xylaria flabelliformis]|nr:cytochrome P450 [Xylaria flabelliformis]